MGNKETSWTLIATLPENIKKRKGSLDFVLY